MLSLTHTGFIKQQRNLKVDLLEAGNVGKPKVVNTSDEGNVLMTKQQLLLWSSQLHTRFL